MVIRALLSFLLLPGIVAGLVPLLLVRSDPWRGRGWTPGIIILAVGLAILLWCVYAFYQRGKGTLAPWDPPQHLVITGLYRYTRNPMYIGVLLTIGGWAVVATSPVLGVYGLFCALAVHLRVLYYEEPTLARLFGAEWEQYMSNTPRWLPRFKPSFGR